MSLSLFHKTCDAEFFHNIDANNLPNVCVTSSNVVSNKQTVVSYFHHVLMLLF